ncbi:DNA adenine methylase [Oceanobacillus piezotolerans]|uniref:Site-specific DNA-methyltransferase (adenine-specific) n=1 Tax=Oceanobacillus piezotolerans TaxID=2448030 RepID=A0A498D4V3_9BACI|nr:DNA adenine methylase [Oceanobacillus piezotolerans]RLL43925.1 DNA adenine methylase [Oceanobacillus piezotolerans]
MDNLQPFIKWVGGKRQLLHEIRKYVPSIFGTYYEPFVGGGAVLFDLAPKNAVINDSNAELINLYKVIKSKRKLEQLIRKLKEHRNEEEYYYKVRAEDRSDDYFTKSDVDRASRFIYLNRTGYNGLYRVNSNGYFNVPFGKYKNPDYVNESVLRRCHEYLNKNNVRITNKDFESAVKGAKAGDLIYFDPPYDPLNETSSFTSYTKDSFGDWDQVRLRNLFIKLYEKGCYVILSNSDTLFINKLYNYPGVQIIKVEASRNVNSKKEGRGKITEVMVIADGTNKER